MNHRAVKGMNDVLPDAVRRWQHLESTFRRVVSLHRFEEVRTPLLEYTELFVRSIGEATDVVDKEMFTFQRGDESLTLRPEGTAGAARAYLSETVYARQPVSRWFYIGPMFRAERPQRGRYRQFWQAGCELYGDAGPVADAEMVAMLAHFLRELGLSDVEVCLNSIGGAESRRRYREALLAYFRPRAAELSEHARDRLEKNPLRVLDSKAPADQAVAAGAPHATASLTDDDRAHWDGLRAALEALGVAYVVDPRLVRGLDYYTRTIFELKARGGDLGAQNTLVGGGRYDGLLSALGGPDVPAIGFAMGLERLLLAMPDTPAPAAAFCTVAPLGEAARLEAVRLAAALRAAGVPTELDARGNSLKSMLRRADAEGARAVLVLGEAEQARGVVQLKDLREKSQTEVALADAPAKLRELLAAPAGAAPRGDE